LEERTEGSSQKKILLPRVINLLQKKRKEKAKEESQPIKDWRKA